MSRHRGPQQFWPQVRPQQRRQSRGDPTSRGNRLADVSCGQQIREFERFDECPIGVLCRDGRILLRGHGARQVRCGLAKRREMVFLGTYAQRLPVGHLRAQLKDLAARELDAQLVRGEALH